MEIKPEHLKKYKDIVTLIIKYGDEDVLKLKDFEKDSATKDVKEPIEKAEGLAKDLEEMGPAFIKLGQLLSTRPDFLPKVYIDELSKLQDKVEPFSYEEVEQILLEEIGVRISKAFEEFDTKPLAAASLGQVHFAKLLDGRPVAVKIQRPNIKEKILIDLEALQNIAESLDKYTDVGRTFEFRNILKEFRSTLLMELDYEQEAENLKTISRNLEKYDTIAIPEPVDDYTTSKVLTMSFIEGKKITGLSPLIKLEIDGEKLAEDLFKAYLDQVLVDGFFHADPHPGNVFLTNDRRIALLDLGMVAHLDPKMQENLLKLLINLAEGKGSEVAEKGLQISSVGEDINRERYIEQVTEFVSRYTGTTLESIKVGRMILELTQIAADNGIRTSNILTMLGKALLNLDEIGNTLAPEFNPTKVIKNHSQSLLEKQMLKNLSPGNLFTSVLETTEFIKELPHRLNSVLDAIVNNKFQIKVKAFEEDVLMKQLQKIANRITLGLVLAALIIGAALMMNIETEFTIFGYPGLAVILFLIAAGFGFALTFSIMFKDKIEKLKNRKRD